MTSREVTEELSDDFVEQVEKPKKRILLIEDNEPTLALMERILSPKNQDYTVVVYKARNRKLRVFLLQINRLNLI